MKRTITVLLFLVLTGCTTTQTPSNSNQPGQPANQPSQPSPAPKQLGDLQVGEASGTIVYDGQTITLKYAYARDGESFGDDYIEVLLTDTPLSGDVAKSFEESRTIFTQDIRGLEYRVGKRVFWLMYHPIGFQTSGINTNTLQDYSVKDGVVRGRDEASDDLSGKTFRRSVSFVARVQDKKK